MGRTVTLVDNQGNALGEKDLVEAHTGIGDMHRAFSIYVFRNGGEEILIQKRAAGKMLWPEIWANTCCSHPFPDEEMMDAATRRLKEECGFTCKLEPVDTFIYRAEDGERGVEHEHVTILRGDTDAVHVDPDPKEIAEIQWRKIEDLLYDMRMRPDDYAPWFHQGLALLLQKGEK